MPPTSTTSDVRASPSTKSLMALPPKILKEETPITSQLVCSICLSVPHVHPVTTSCDHIFCEECLVEAAKRSMHCPVCNQNMQKRHSSSSKYFSPLRGLSLRCWEAIPIECPVQGCGWSGTMGAYSTHMRRCDGAATTRIRRLEAEIKKLKYGNEDFRLKVHDLTLQNIQTKNGARKSKKKMQEELQSLKNDYTQQCKETKTLRKELRKSNEKVTDLEESLEKWKRYHAKDKEKINNLSLQVCELTRENKQLNRCLFSKRSSRTSRRIDRSSSESSESDSDSSSSRDRRHRSSRRRRRSSRSPERKRRRHMY